MVVDRAYLESISNSREKRLMMLSYRRYRRLNRLHGSIGREIFDKYKSAYTPKIWVYALSLYFHGDHKKPFSRKYFRKAKRWEKVWDEILSNLPYESIYLTDDKLEKEFEFRGFIKNLKTRKLYAYVSSNRPINGNRWIHPQRFTSNIISAKKRPSLPNIYRDWVPYILEGYTKILRYESYN